MEQGTFHNTMAMLETSIYFGDFPWQTVSHNQRVVITEAPSMCPKRCSPATPQSLAHGDPLRCHGNPPTLVVSSGMSNIIST